MEDGEKPLDLLGSVDDLDPDFSRRPTGSRSAMFQPKLKGKIKAEPSADTGPLRPPLRPVPVKKKEEEDVAVVKVDEPSSQDPLSALSVATDDAEESASNPMEVDDDGEDRVVREIDVFFSPSLDEGACLYVMQYPLRPSWRPYELDERCEEVRVKPTLSKVEVDLSMNVHSENYDPEVAGHLRLQKQTLSSSKAPFLTDYAVGIMIGNQLHLNPVHAVVQLRPSMTHVGGVQKRKPSARNQEVSTKPGEENIDESLKPSTRQGKMVSEDSNENKDDAEPWVSLEYHTADSLLSSRYKQKMAAEQNNHIHFAMKSSDYVNSLCPGTSTGNKIVKGPPRRVLLSMPLEERLKKWLSEVCQVNRFVALMHLAPTNTTEEVLKVLQNYADLVQGLWVSKSSLLYEGREARVRDYVLSLFSKDRVIQKNKLKTLKVSDDTLRHMLRPLAVERSTLNDWKFREDTDSSFKKQYPDIVEEQKRAWSSREKEITDSLHVPIMTKNSLNPNMAKRATVSGKVNPGVNKSKDGRGSSATTTMSNEVRDALPKALLKLFHVHKVRSLNSITRGLREMALKKSSLWKEDQETKTFVNAANGVSAPSPELKSVISQLAVNIHGVYVLKSGGNPALDSLRNVVIKLFLEREPNAKLEKQEIERAAQLSLKRDISDSEYNEVVSELCINSKGAWVLKSGD